MGREGKGGGEEKKGRKEGENWLSRSQEQTVNQDDNMSTKLHCSLIVVLGSMLPGHSRLMVLLKQRGIRKPTPHYSVIGCIYITGFQKEKANFRHF